MLNPKLRKTYTVKAVITDDETGWLLYYANLTVTKQLLALCCSRDALIDELFRQLAEKIKETPFGESEDEADAKTNTP